MQISREKHRNIKGYSKEEMERFLSSIYISGYNDGIEALSKKIVPIIGDALRETPGIGEKRFNEAMTKIAEKFSL